VGAEGGGWKSVLSGYRQVFLAAKEMEMRWNPRYQKSQELLKRSLKRIPIASQTFSKSHILLPTHSAPLFLSHGKGSRAWDVDGHEYIDLINGLLPVVLGYCDPDVDAAVMNQMKKGVSFSLATTLEIELAEVLSEIIPCAEMVRYGKNGSDVTTAAIRIARAHTGRERVATGGYHGWHDWYIGATTRNKGVPKAVCELTHRFEYNKLTSLEGILDAHPGEFAAVIMEPMNTEEPSPGFLAGVRDLAHKHGALFILDEIITGFRYHLGGAQTYFGVTPDLATFGKSMGNGFPISVIAGKAEFMKEMEEIFYSFTFGGEALSLAAALATVSKMKKEPVIEKLWKTGKKLSDGTEAEIKRHGLEDVVKLKGMPPWKVFEFKDREPFTAAEIKSLFFQEVLERGILMWGNHNVSYAFTDEDLDTILSAYAQVTDLVAEALVKGDLRDRLYGPAPQPLFKVR
jgi:glutamate-1-semialdehyde 2,1-aminomutase